MSVDYSSQKIWQERFTKFPDNFEWLGGADNILPVLAPLIQDQRILHIGCGTSNLAFALREALKVPPSQILNLDYAQRAVELGQELESRTGGAGMRWAVADLLDWASVQVACADMAPFGLVLDKSTSDAIACGYEVDVRLPFLPGRPTAQLEPMTILALHLAALVQPGAHWAAMSYSSTRFDFLQDALPVPISGVQRASDLWMVERRLEQEAFQHGPQSDWAINVHRPPVMNHIYILRRTATPLEVWPLDDF